MVVLGHMVPQAVLSIPQAALRAAEDVRFSQQDAVVRAERQAAEALRDSRRLEGEVKAAEAGAQELLDINTQLEEQVGDMDSRSDRMLFFDV